MSCVIFCYVCYSVLCVFVGPLPQGINQLAVINNIYICIYIYIYITGLSLGCGHVNEVYKEA